jgi:hypothetical protein
MDYYHSMHVLLVEERYPEKRGTFSVGLDIWPQLREDDNDR